MITAVIMAHLSKSVNSQRGEDLKGGRSATLLGDRPPLPHLGCLHQWYLGALEVPPVRAAASQVPTGLVS